MSRKIGFLEPPQNLRFLPDESKEKSTRMGRFENNLDASRNFGKVLRSR
jgi:hypothetical protein